LYDFLHRDDVHAPAVEYAVFAEDPDLCESRFPIETLPPLVRVERVQDDLVEARDHRVFFERA
jgi:hypothetical protein